MRSVRRGLGRTIASWRGAVCLPLIVILPVSLWADDAAAMLRSNGAGILVNKNPAPASVALFPDDLIETQSSAVARIDLSGSTADINPESVVQFQLGELVLDHGTLSVNTERALRVRVGCILVTPAHEEWTHYEVTDLDGKVTVSALKNDVNIDTRTAGPNSAKQAKEPERVSVHEGEQKSREEKCGGPPFKESGKFAARGAIMNSPWARGGGIIAVGVITCFALCQSSEPVSPSRP